MTNVTLTITDPDGGTWSVDLRPELYALLVATSQRSAASSGDAEMRVRPGERSTPAAVVAAELERSLLQRMDEGEGTGVGGLIDDALRLLMAVRKHATIDAALAAEIQHVLMRARAAGLDWSCGEQSAPTTVLRWHVRGVISYNLAREAPDETALVDMTVAASDWHAAETTAVAKVRAALELYDDRPFAYEWTAGPDVTPLNAEDKPREPGR